jgi:hypothetical protein
MCFSSCKEPSEVHSLEVGIRFVSITMLHVDCPMCWFCRKGVVFLSLAPPTSGTTLPLMATLKSEPCSSASFWLLLPCMGMARSLRKDT